MKAKFLLSTLAFGAALVACNNEDILVNENVAADEIVGAKLLGKGLTMGIGTEDTESRATANGWENGDVAGIAWVTDGSATDSQAGKLLSNVGTTVWSNYFYQYNQGVWSTRSNIYEGWHFAYRPYQHQKNAGQLEIVVNGKAMTKEDHRADVNDNAPYISAAEFLGEDLVDYAEGSIDVTYDISRIANVIKPKLLISEDFTGHADLNTIAITGVTVAESRADKPMFVNSIKVNPALLPQIQYKKYTEGEKKGEYILVDGKKQYDKAATLELLNAENLYGMSDDEDNVYALYNKAIKLGNFSTSETTEIDGEYYVLDGDKTVRMFLAPVRNYTANINTLSFVVNVEGGHFTIAYTEQKFDKNGKKIEFTETEKKNNAAIEKMVALLNGTFKNDAGKIRSLRTMDPTVGAQTIEMSLGLENFTADYLIEDIDDWNASVKLSNALNPEDAPTFTLKNGAKVKFTNEIQVPAMGVKVTSENSAVYSSNLIIDGNLTWDQNVEIVSTGVSVHVNKDKELTVEGVLAPARLVNDGTIYAGALSTIGKSTAEHFVNNNRVVVEYGAYVYPQASKPGIVAYQVNGTESAAKINTLIASTGNKNGHAKVNTLIIGNNVSLDLTKTDADDVDNDRYNGATATGSVLANLNEVAIEMYGGTIKAKKDAVKSVKNVTVFAGVNTVQDITIVGELLVEAGSVTVDATEYEVKTKVDGKDVVTKVKDAATVGSVELANGGVLTVNVNTYTDEILNAGKIVVNDPYTLFWKNESDQSKGESKGNIKQGSN